MFGDIRLANRVAFTAAFIGLIALGSWISIPFFTVPLTLQTLFVFLAAIVMKREAVIPVTLYIVLGALGLPLFHNGLAGIGVLLGPTGGYLAGFILAAGIAGIACEQGLKVLRIVGIVSATAVIYACGTGWLMVSTGMGLIPALVIGVLPFLPGDAVKAYAACRIAERFP